MRYSCLFFFILLKVQIFFPKSPKSADIPPPAPLNMQVQRSINKTWILQISPEQRGRNVCECAHLQYKLSSVT